MHSATPARAENSLKAKIAVPFTRHQEDIQHSGSMMDSWDHEELLDLIGYQPEKNSFFDIWQYEGVTEPNIEEGVLHGENLDQYLSRASNVVHDRQLIGGLRLLYSYVDVDIDYSDKTVFWSRSDFLKIMESFHLPKRFTQMTGRCHCFFAQCPLDRSDADTERFCYAFSTLFHHSPFWCVAASWDPERNITYAFLHCTSDPEEESIPRLKRFLIKIALLAMHPVLLPVLIMDLETNLTLRDDERWTTEINEIENETRQRPYAVTNVDPVDLNLSSIVQRLNGCSVFLSLIERESETVLLHLAQAHAVISELKPTSPRLGESAPILIKHMEFLIHSRKNLFLRLQNLQRRSQTQLAFTYNFLAQRDNKLNIEVTRESKVIALASSRDSKAMKTVAILTIIFLPGTFVASFFAMPLFNWQASSNRAIVGPYFWIYWAFTIPLTALVLGTWAIWIQIILKRHEKEDKKMQAKSFLGWISEKSSTKGSHA